MRFELAAIRKSFGAVCAVRDAFFSITEGEVVALLGENGAGKSTLMRIAAGLLAPDGGTISIDGERVVLDRQAGATRHGIAMVPQHFALMDAFSVADNLALAAIDLPALYSGSRLESAAEAIVARSGIAIGRLDRRVAELSVGEKAKLELAKALARRPRLLILDEPTSVLTPMEVGELFDSLRGLAAAGLAIVLITHKLPEAFAIAQRVVVMRGGAIISGATIDATSPAEVAALMVPPAERPPARVRTPPGEPVLSLRGVSTMSGERQVALDGIRLEIRAGEVVAIAGVAGNGQTELGALLRGLVLPKEGAIEILGRRVTPRDLFQRRDVGHIPEDRAADGLVEELTLGENLALGDPRWSRRDGRRAAEKAIESFAIRASSPDQPAGTLSGGNQQKLLLARELTRAPRLVVAAEPTRGLDLRSAADVRARLAAAAAEGAAVLLITSDLDEAFALADSVCVMYRGRLSPRMPAGDSRDRVASLMAGVA